MVGFVENAACCQIGQIVFELLTGNILCPRDDTHFSFHHLVQAGKGKTALVAYLLTFNADYLRVDENDLVGFGVSCGPISQSGV